MFKPVSLLGREEVTSWYFGVVDDTETGLVPLEVELSPRAKEKTEKKRLPNRQKMSKVFGPQADSLQAWAKADAPEVCSQSHLRS